MRVVATREPGGTALGDRLRAIFGEPGLRIDPVAEAMIVNAARAQHVAEIIAPALSAGTWIVCDRFTAATLAYQGYGRCMERATLQILADIATAGGRPDVTLLLDVPVAVSRERIAARMRSTGVDADRIEREGAAFHERVRDGYLALAAVDRSFVTLDGTLAPEELCEVAWQALAERFWP